MTRTRATAKQSGSAFERLIADCLAAHVDTRIDRRVKTGARDRGDIAALRVHGQRVVAEVKDYGGKYHVGPWLTEAEVERGHDHAVAGVVVAKRRGKRDPLEQVVFLTVRDLIAIVTGQRPE